MMATWYCALRSLFTRALCFLRAFLTLSLVLLKGVGCVCGGEEE